ncbi:MAG: LCP family protein [Acidimicrobiales bacterium]
MEAAPPPVASPEAGAPARAWRWIRAHPLVSGLGAAVLVVVLVAGSLAWWTRRQIEEIPTFDEAAPGVVDLATDGTTSTTTPLPGVPVSDAPAPPVPPPGERAITYLVFSTGSDGLSSAEAQRLEIPPERAAMADRLTDSIMLVVVHPKTREVAVLSIPRDLYLPSIGDRINTVFVRSGPRALAETVGRLTGLPVDHMVAVNFTAFGELADALGGVDLWVDGPARDLNTGFEVEGSGCVHLDAAKALAFARSRHWEVRTAAGWAPSTADDFGRIQRQQRFLRAAARKLASPTGLFAFGPLLGTAQRTLTIDRDLDVVASANLARELLADPATTIATFSYQGTPGWAGPASVVYGDAGANAGTLAELQRVLRGEPPAPAAPGDPAPPALPPPAAGSC